MNFLTTIGVVLVIIVLVLGSCALRWSIWNECRQSHSWLYCMHTVGGK